MQVADPAVALPSVSNRCIASEYGSRVFRVLRQPTPDGLGIRHPAENLAEMDGGRGHGNSNLSSGRCSRHRRRSVPKDLKDVLARKRAASKIWGGIFHEGVHQFAEYGVFVLD